MDKDFSDILEKNKSTVLLVAIIIVGVLSLMFVSVSGAWSTESPSYEYEFQLIVDTDVTVISEHTSLKLDKKYYSTVVLNNLKDSNNNQIIVTNNLDKDVKISSPDNIQFVEEEGAVVDSIIVESGSKFSGNLNIDNVEDDKYSKEISYTVVE